jgi:hypothetical protein
MGRSLSTGEEATARETGSALETAPDSYGGFNAYRYNAPAGPLTLAEIAQHGAVFYSPTRSGRQFVGVSQD